MPQNECVIYNFLTILNKLWAKIVFFMWDRLDFVNEYDGWG